MEEEIKKLDLTRLLELLKSEEPIQLNLAEALLVLAECCENLKKEIKPNAPAPLHSSVLYPCQ